MGSSKIQFLIFFLTILKVRSENISSGSICQTHDGSEGRCVRPNSCDVLLDRLRSGSMLRSQVVTCNKSIQLICCPIETLSISSRMNQDRGKEHRFYKFIFLIELYIS